jgi:hypothetical protein
VHWSGRFSDEVTATRSQLTRALALLEQVPRNHPGHPDQKSHGRKGGTKADAQTADLPRVENPEDRRAQAMGTNPGYLGPYTGPVTPKIKRDGGANYAENCSRVVIAYEMRRRGIDVTAGAGSPVGDTIAAYVHTFRQDGKYSLRLAEDLSRNMSVRQVATEVESWPHGARGIVTIQGHTLSVERDTKTGKAVFIDAQTAKKKSPVLTRAQLEARMKSRGAPTDKWTAVARVDDLDLSDHGLRYVESPRLSIADGQVGKTAFPTDPDSPTFSSFEQIAALPPDDSYP